MNKHNLSLYDSTAEQIGDISKVANNIYLRYADLWRGQHLLPFCRRHRLRYVAGMGTEPLFIAPNGKTLYSKDLAMDWI